MSRTLISYDSPWGDIVDAARSAQWTPAPQFCTPVLNTKITSEDVRSMVAAPHCAIIDPSELPPIRRHAQDDALDSLSIKMRAYKIREIAEQQGMPDVFPWEVVAQRASSFCGFAIGTLHQTAGQKLRNTQGGDEFHLATPLRYRLNRVETPQYVLVMLNTRLTQADHGPSSLDRMPALADSDRLSHISLHETFHAVQRRHLEGQQGSIQDRAELERDAENSATIAIQTGLGASPALAAAMIMQNTLVANLFYAPHYNWWPGLAEAQLGHGPLHTQTAYAAGLHAAVGKPVPDQELLTAWAHSVVSQDFKSYRMLYGQPFSQMCDFILRERQKDYERAGRLVVSGLSRLEDRLPDILPAASCDYAAKLLDAAAFVCPSWVGRDALERRPQTGASGLKLVAKP